MERDVLGKSDLVRSLRKGGGARAVKGETFLKRGFSGFANDSRISKVWKVSSVLPPRGRATRTPPPVVVVADAVAADRTTTLEGGKEG